LVTSSDRDAPSARQTNARTPEPKPQDRTPRPAARASLPLPIHSVKQQTAQQATRLAKALKRSPKKSPHLNEGTRLIRSRRRPRQSSFDSPIRGGRRPGEALRWASLNGASSFRLALYSPSAARLGRNRKLPIPRPFMDICG